MEGQIIVSIALFLVSVHAFAITPTEYGQLLFQRLAGHPLLLSDPRYASFQEAIQARRLAEAATIATNDDGFYDVTLRIWAGLMTTRPENPYQPLNDTIATAIGIVRDGLDARWMLTGDFLYGPDPRFGLGRPAVDSNAAYLGFEASHRSLRRYLIRYEPQFPGVPMTSGMLTTYGWASTFYSAGTNRRAVDATFRSFLCSPIETWRDASIQDFRVRRDVDRQPSGDPQAYQRMCRACHAPMDGLAGAFSNYDFSGGSIRFLTAVAPKYNQNITVYPDGYTTGDDSWINQLTRSQHERFGWRSSLNGDGLREFGWMIANSRGFSSCMVKRAFETVCKKDVSELGYESAENIADEFETGGYQLRPLFEKIAIQNQCLSEEPVVGLKHFSETLEALATATDTYLRQEPTILNAYNELQSRLPRNGQASEFSGVDVMATVGLGSLFCNRLIETESALNNADRDVFQNVDFTNGPDRITLETRQQILQALALRFWQRPIEANEMSGLLSFMTDAPALIAEPQNPAKTRRFLLTTCSLFAGTPSFSAN